MLDARWLDSLEAEMETEHVRLIHFDEPLEVAVNAKQGRGIVMKPEHRMFS